MSIESISYAPKNEIQVVKQSEQFQGEIDQPKNTEFHPIQTISHIVNSSPISENVEVQSNTDNPSIDNQSESYNLPNNYASPPSVQTTFFNNTKFNESMISVTASILLCLTVVLAFITYFWFSVNSRKNNVL